MADPARPQKSTNVRSRIVLASLRFAFRSAGLLAPALAARAAAALFGLPPRHSTSDAERRLLELGRRSFLRTPSGRVATWRWGEGPVVLLVHGWGSRGARLSSFVEPLLAAGFAVVTFDAPGHGESAGRLSSLPQFIEALLAVAEAHGPVEALVAHSLGGAAAALAIARGLSLERAVFLAPAANPDAYLRRFAEIAGISAAVRDRMERHFERRFGFRWQELDVPRGVGAVTTPLLVFHDEEDPEVPWTDGESIARAWPGARLVTTRDLGHKRIVHDPGVVSEATAFLTEGVVLQREVGR